MLSMGDGGSSAGVRSSGRPSSSGGSSAGGQKRGAAEQPSRPGAQRPRQEAATSSSQPDAAPKPPQRDSQSSKGKGRVGASKVEMLQQSGAAAMEALLIDLGLGQYAAAFDENGYDDVAVMRRYDDAEWAELREHTGMKPGHVAKLKITMREAQAS